MFFKAFLSFSAVKPAWAALLLIVLSSLCSAAFAQPYSVTDSTGKGTRFERPPERIVSLLPSLAETVCVLGACKKIVGLDRYTVWPPELDTVPKVGGGLDPNIEAIVALRPDVVLVSHASRVSGRLRALGLRVLVMEPKTHADVKTTTYLLAQALGLPTSAADKIWLDIQTRSSKAAASVPVALRGKRLYFEVSRGPYAAGETSFIGETISRLGLGNIVGKDLGPFPKLNPEYIVQKDPDYILAGDHNMPEMMRYPGWEHLTAMKTGRSCLFSREQIDILIHPGPRLGEGAELIAACVLGKIKHQS